MKRAFSILAAALAAALRAGPAAFGQTDQVVFDDALRNGWGDWGWTQISYTNTTPVHAGTRSIRVTIAGAWEAIYIARPAFDSGPYSNLVFWMHGGSAGGQQLALQGVLGSTAQPGVALAPPPAGAWQEYAIPLAALGVADRTNFTGFWIQDSAGHAQSTFYLDDVRLGAAPVAATAHVAVDAAHAVRRVDARAFGLNAAVWDGYFDTPGTLALLREAGVAALRFPGGSLADTYHWTSNTTGTNAWTWGTSFDAFMHIATNLGAQVFVTVNYGTSTPDDAAAWVAHARANYGAACRWWEVGNECYGDWEADTRARPHDPWSYAAAFQDYRDRMKAADPAVRVGAVVETGEDTFVNYTDHPATNARTGVAHNGWTPVLLARLRTLGAAPDFVIYHYYAQEPGAENDALLLQSAAAWPALAADLRQQLADYLGPAGTNVELVCTENGSVSYSPGKQNVSLVNALYSADSLGQMLQTEFAARLWWDLRNGRDTADNNLDASLYGWRMYGDYGWVFENAEPTNRYPPYYAAKIAARFAAGGDTVVAASSDLALCAAYACRRADGRLCVLLVNKSPTLALTNQIALSGFTPASNATAVAYGIAQDDAARTGTGSPDLAQTPWTVAGTNLTYVAPPYSLSVLELQPRGSTLAARPGPPFGLHLDGDAGSRYAIEASADLLGWTPLATNTLDGGTNDWSDASAPSFPRRFYRAVWVP